MREFLYPQFNELLASIIIAVPIIVLIGNVIVIRRRRREVPFGLTA